MSAGAVVALDEVTLSLPGPPPATPLRSLSLAVEDGDFVAVTGPSGSGKSSLLNVVGLLEPPTSGTYTLDGIDVGDLRDKDRSRMRGGLIGFVFQSFHLIDHRTVLDNVTIGSLYRNRDPSADEARQALDRVGLSHRLDASPLTLSGGEQQRVAIARAVMGRPRLLLCDEPTGNLDDRAGGHLMDLLDELHHDGLTIILVSHDARVAARADRQLRIDDGRTVEL